MHFRAVAVSALFLLLGACSRALPRAAPPAGDTDGPVDCRADQFKAKEQCFDHARDACASLGCGTACDIHQARSSRWVTCSLGAAGSSQLTRCDGYAGWLCPEGEVCRDDPSPGACTAALTDDCVGVCVPIADAGPAPPGRR